MVRFYEHLNARLRVTWSQIANFKGKKVALGGNLVADSKFQVEISQYAGSMPIWIEVAEMTMICVGNNGSYPQKPDRPDWQQTEQYQWFS